MANLQLDNVTKEFPDGTTAVDGIDLAIHDQEFLVLVGPSGCGKSTTLRMIAGLETATSGKISIGDRRVNDVPPKDRDIAMVFQNYALYPHMSVYKNMAFGLYLRYGGNWLARLVRRLIQPAKAKALNTRRSGIDELVRTTAERLGIDSLLQRKPHQLSGGERQRVALGRAIVRKPAVFLFDEPLSNLDAKLRQRMRVELKRLHQEIQTTMIYVTHDQVEAMTLGDRVAVMNAGSIQQIGDPLDIYRNPSNLFVARFFGSVPINLWQGTVRRQGKRITTTTQQPFFFETEFDEPERILSDGNESEVTLGFRAEALKRVEDLETANLVGNLLAVDRLGDSAILHLDTAGQAPGSARFLDENEIVFARVKSGAQLKTGQKIGFRVEPEDVLWFDSKSGDNIWKDHQ